MTGGGSFSNLGYPARSLQTNNPFGSMTRRQLYDSGNANGPYSTSAGSGGSAENSASSHGYEDDFPELTTVSSKFNNLRLETDPVDTQIGGNGSINTNNRNGNNQINASSDQQQSTSTTGTNNIQQVRHFHHEQQQASSSAQINNCNGHVSPTQQGSSRFISF